MELEFSDYCINAILARQHNRQIYPWDRPTLGGLCYLDLHESPNKTGVVTDFNPRKSPQKTVFFVNQFGYFDLPLKPLLLQFGLDRSPKKIAKIIFCSCLTKLEGTVNGVWFTRLSILGIAKRLSPIETAFQIDHSML